MNTIYIYIYIYIYINNSFKNTTDTLKQYCIQKWDSSSTSSSSSVMSKASPNKKSVNMGFRGAAVPTDDGFE